MDVDNRAQETPCSTLPVHVQHSQDLQEANPSGKFQCLKADIVHACRHVWKLCQWVIGLQQLFWGSFNGCRCFHPHSAGGALEWLRCHLVHTDIRCFYSWLLGTWKDNSIPWSWLLTSPSLGPQSKPLTSDPIDSDFNDCITFSSRVMDL